MRLLPTSSALALVALSLLTAAAVPANRLVAQSQGATVDERSRPVSYDFFVQYEGVRWEGSLIIYPDSAIVLPRVGSCKELDRMRRRVTASQESWPCDGPSSLADFQIVVDRQNHKATQWKATAQRPFEKTTTNCAITRTDSNGKEICVAYEKITDYKATPVSGRIDLVPRATSRP